WCKEITMRTNHNPLLRFTLLVGVMLISSAHYRAHAQAWHMEVHANGASASAFACDMALCNLVTVVCNRTPQGTETFLNIFFHSLDPNTVDVISVLGLVESPLPAVLPL